MKANVLFALSIASGLIAACSPSVTPVGEGTTPSTSATPGTAAFCNPSNPCLALVTLRGSDDLVVRDITDMANPKTVRSLGARLRSPVFVNAASVSYIEHSEGADQDRLILLPLDGKPTTVVATAPHGIVLYAFSPDGTTAAYLTNGSAQGELHLVTAGVDKVVGQVPEIVGGCETQACAFRSDARLAYSPNGQWISLVQSFGGPNFRVWTSEGKLITSNPPGTGYRMSVWSRNVLYFVDSTGLAAWQYGDVSPFLANVFWIRPKGSPSDGRVVYAASDSAGSTHVFVIDSQMHAVSELKPARREPAFLTSRFIWYEGERSCLPSDLCDQALPVTTSGKTYIYDTQDGSETESGITKVMDVWPHAA